MLKLNKVGLSKKPTQLEHIKRSTQHVFDAQTIKKINHFEFPPWQYPAKFQCHISPASKEQAKEVHLPEFDRLQNSNNSNTTLIFTDASTMEESQGVGVGIYIRDLTQRTNESFSTNFSPKTLVFDGELEGITQGLEYASRVAKRG